MSGVTGALIAARVAEKGDRDRCFGAGDREAKRPPGNDSGARRLRHLYANRGKHNTEQGQAAAQNEAPDHLD